MLHGMVNAFSDIDIVNGVLHGQSSGITNHFLVGPSGDAVGVRNEQSLRAALVKL